MTVRWPIPAAARYSSTGEPSPPAPTTSTRLPRSLRCASSPNPGSTMCRAYRAWSRSLRTVSPRSEAVLPSPVMFGPGVPVGRSSPENLSPPTSYSPRTIQQPLDVPAQPHAPNLPMIVGADHCRAGIGFSGLRNLWPSSGHPGVPTRHQASTWSPSERVAKYQCAHDQGLDTSETLPASAGHLAELRRRSWQRRISRVRFAGLMPLRWVMSSSCCAGESVPDSSSRSRGAVGVS